MTQTKVIALLDIENIILFVTNNPKERFVICLNTSKVHLNDIKYFGAIKNAFGENIVEINMFSESCFAQIAYYIVSNAEINLKNDTMGKLPPKGVKKEAKKKEQVYLW